MTNGCRCVRALQTGRQSEEDCDHFAHDGRDVRMCTDGVAELMLRRGLCKV